MNLLLVAPESLDNDAEREAIRFIRYGVTGVDAAFASTGSMLMISGPGKSRAASLLPYYHIGLIPFSRLYPTVEAWLAEQREAETLLEALRDQANVTMITGPSKSADIEMNLTLGVHGPKFVHAILFDDESTSGDLAFEDERDFGGMGFDDPSSYQHLGLRRATWIRGRITWQTLTTGQTRHGASPSSARARWCRRDIFPVSGVCRAWRRWRCAT